MAEQVKAVKADSGEWILEVLGLPWGGPNNGRDSDGEFFSADTRFHEDKYPLPPVVYYHGYGDDGKPMGEPAYIGKTVERSVRPDGVWFRVILDKASELAKRVWSAAQDGIARASSGSSHLRRVASDGHILEWPVTELSIFDAIGDRQPANAYAVALPAMKAVYAQAGIMLPADIESEPEAEAKSGPTKGAAAQNAERPTPTPTNDSTGEIKMDDIKTAVAEAMQAERERIKDEQERAAALEVAKQDAIKAARAEWEAEAAKANRLPGGSTGAPAVVDSSLWKFDGIPAGDIAMSIQVLRRAQRSGLSQHGSSDAAVKALAMRLEADECKNDMGYRESYGLLKARLPEGVKANELNQSTLASYGDEWVGTAYGTELWRSIRHGTPILNAQMAYAVPQPAGAETLYFPLEGADPTWYLVAQASALSANPGGVPTNTVTASKLGTAQQSRTMAKLGARVLWTGELEEDAVVNFAGELRSQLAQSGMEMLESLIIDGDTATGATTNINDIAGTPGGTEYWLGVDGYRKLALVTNTANSRDGGSLASVDYLETLKLMGNAGRNAIGSDRVAFITDLWTYWKSLELTEVLTLQVNSQATVESGMLTRMWGYPIYKSPNMHKPSADATYGLKANANGKIDQDTASNNAKGAILAVRWDQWRPGYRRQMTTETTRIPAADATEIVSLLRFGMIYRDTDAAAISYNLTV